MKRFSADVSIFLFSHYSILVLLLLAEGNILALSPAEHSFFRTCRHGGVDVAEIYRQIEVLFSHFVQSNEIVSNCVWREQPHWIIFDCYSSNKGVGMNAWCLSFDMPLFSLILSDNDVELINNSFVLGFLCAQSLKVLLIFIGIILLLHRVTFRWKTSIANELNLHFVHRSWTYDDFFPVKSSFCCVDLN